MRMADKSSLSLTALLWDDVLIPHILSYLSLKDLFHLRGISKDLKKLVERYFSLMKTCNLSEYSDSFTPTAFSVLMENCKQLRYFIAVGCVWLSNRMVKYIVLNNLHLTHIDLSYCCNLTSVALQPVIINLKNLACLKLKNSLWLTTGCLEALALHHSKIEELSLSGCCNIGDVQAINILLKRLPNLRDLELCGIHCVSDATMEVIAHCNTKLISLNVNGCHLVTCYGVTMVSEYCHELRYFYLAECSVTFETIQRLKKKVFIHLYSKQDFGPVRRVPGDAMELLVRLPV